MQVIYTDKPIPSIYRYHKNKQLRTVNNLRKIKSTREKDLVNTKKLEHSDIHAQKDLKGD
jgi:hypothetical protein